MRTYWEATVKHTITDENGKLKKVNSVYLVDAVNHTEVEARLTQKMSEIIQGDFEIKPIRQSDITRVVVVQDTGNYFKVKIEFDFEKKETESILVEAADLESALSGFVKTERFLNFNFWVISVSQTKIRDVYDFDLSWQDEILTREPLDDLPEVQGLLHSGETFSATVSGDFEQDNNEAP